MTKTPKELAEFDQEAAEMGDTLPGAVWELYGGFQRKGFTEPQAFTLTRDWMRALVGKQIPGTDSQ